MHILIDITHPAHVHFFKNSLHIWRDMGHAISITTRDKDITLSLLDNLGIAYTNLSKAATGLKGLVRELPIRDARLVAFVRKHRPDVLLAIGGIFIAHVGLVTRTPSVVFYDTENARVQNLLTYPVATRICTPACYENWVPAKKHVPYAGYHELAYTHPDYFTPESSVLSRFGLSHDEDFIVMRLVSWGATHDVGDSGITNAEQVVESLSRFGRVLITSERHLPGVLERHRISVSPELVHHLLYFARLFIGESATMASECAAFGTPAVFISTSRRGYTNELERRFDLVYTFSDPATCQADGLEKALEILSDPDSKEKWCEKSAAMRAQMTDVTRFIVQTALEFAPKTRP